MSIARTVFSRSILRIAGSLLRVVVTAYIAVFLGAATLGAYALYRTVVLFFSILTDLGIQQAIIKRISGREDQDEFFTAFLIVSLVLLAGTLWLLFLTRDIMAAYLGRDLFSLVFLGLLGQTGVGVVNSTLIGENEIQTLSVLEFVQKSVMSVLQIILTASVGLELRGLIWGEIIGFTFIVSAGAVIISETLTKPERHHFTELFDFSRYAWLTPISQRVRAKMDVVILGLFVPTMIVGVYELVWVVSSIFSYVPQALQTTLFPEVSERSAAEKRIEELIGKSIEYSWVLVIPGVFGALIVGEQLLGSFGSVYQQGYITLVVLLGARVAMSTYDILTSYYSGINRPEVTFVGTLSVITANLIGNVVFVALFGLVGAAIATGLAFTLGAGYLFGKNFSLLDTIHLQLLEKGVIGSILMSGMAFGTLIVANRIVGDEIAVGSAIGIGGVTYVTYLLAVAPEIRRLAWRLVDSLRAASFST